MFVWWSKSKNTRQVIKHFNLHDGFSGAYVAVSNSASASVGLKLKHSSCVQREQTEIRVPTVARSLTGVFQRVVFSHHFHANLREHESADFAGMKYLQPYGVSYAGTFSISPRRTPRGIGTIECWILRVRNMRNCVLFCTFDVEISANIFLVSSILMTHIRFFCEIKKSSNIRMLGSEDVLCRVWRFGARKFAVSAESWSSESIFQDFVGSRIWKISVGVKFRSTEWHWWPATGCRRDVTAEYLRLSLWHKCSMLRSWAI